MIDETKSIGKGNLPSPQKPPPPILPQIYDSTIREKLVDDERDFTNVDSQQISSDKEPKKKGTACLNCRRCHARCDLQRPCSRCIKKGTIDLCIDIEKPKSLQWHSSSIQSPKMIFFTRSSNSNSLSSPFLSKTFETVLSNSKGNENTFSPFPSSVHKNNENLISQTRSNSTTFVSSNDSNLILPRYSSSFEKSYSNEFQNISFENDSINPIRGSLDPETLPSNSSSDYYIIPQNNISETPKEIGGINNYDSKEDRPKVSENNFHTYTPRFLSQYNQFYNSWNLTNDLESVKHNPYSRPENYYSSESPHIRNDRDYSHISAYMNQNYYPYYYNEFQKIGTPGNYPYSPDIYMKKTPYSLPNEEISFGGYFPYYSYFERPTQHIIPSRSPPLYPYYHTQDPYLYLPNAYYRTYPKSHSFSYHTPPTQISTPSIPNGTYIYDPTPQLISINQLHSSQELSNQCSHLDREHTPFQQNLQQSCQDIDKYRNLYTLSPYYRPHSLQPNSSYSFIENSLPFNEYIDQQNKNTKEENENDKNKSYIEIIDDSTDGKRYQNQKQRNKWREEIHQTRNEKRLREKNNSSKSKRHRPPRKSQNRISNNNSPNRSSPVLRNGSYTSQSPSSSSSSSSSLFRSRYSSSRSVSPSTPPQSSSDTSSNLNLSQNSSPSSSSPTTTSMSSSSSSSPSPPLSPSDLNSSPNKSNSPRLLTIPHHPYVSSSEAASSSSSSPSSSQNHQKRDKYMRHLNRHYFSQSRSEQSSYQPSKQRYRYERSHQKSSEKRIEQEDYSNINSKYEKKHRYHPHYNNIHEKISLEEKNTNNNDKKVSKTSIMTLLN